jgi:hypothetical protein
MVVTVLEARVDADKWPALETAYRSTAQNLEPGMIRTYLVQNSADPGLWRAMAFWTGRDAVEQMRRSGKTPPGVLIFRAVGVEPVRSAFDVLDERPLQP